MNRLSYFLQLMGNSKYHSGKQCAECGCIPMILNDFHYLSSQLLGICSNKYCSTNKGRTEKELYLKTITFFHEYANYTDNRCVTFQMTNEREYNLCLKFLFEIERKYDCREGDFIITSDITGAEWHEYFYQLSSQ